LAKYQVRVQRNGPEEVASLADSFNQMAEALQILGSSSTTNTGTALEVGVI